MSALPGSEFEKRRECPSSEALLSYQQRGLNRRQTSQIVFHLAACDFCTAELQLLSRYPAAVESPETPPVPVSLRTLAEALLNRNRFGTAGLLERMFEQRTDQGNIRCDDFVSGR
jgi:hypothetical protein